MVNQEKDPADDLEPSAALPRGRHGLPPDVVEQHQRERVAAAVASVLEEDGYSAATVERLHSEAGISRSTFYRHFQNREEAVIASYDLYFERFSEELAARCSKQPDREGRVREALAFTFELAAEYPDKANLLFGFPLGVEPSVSSHVFETHKRLFELVCRKEAGNSLPDIVYQAVIGGVAQLLAQRLVESDSIALSELEEALLAFLLRFDDA